MRKWIFAVFFAILFAFPVSVHAFNSTTYLTVTNPVRGPEGWSNNEQTPLDLPRFEFNEATSSGVPATWLLRYDAVTDATISSYFQKVISIRPDHELGALLEITPKLAAAADVDYPAGDSMLNADRIFLSGYRQTDRLKLIDTFMAAFKQRFGFYPHSVGAWHIDAYSLNYLRQKYSVLTAMIGSEQNGASEHIWGGYLDSPYTPSATNVLLPSQYGKARINIAIVREPAPDLFNLYNNFNGPTYSTQLNNYLLSDTSTDYFEKLIAQQSQKDFNEFTTISFGFDNHYSLKLYSNHLAAYYSILKSKVKTGQLKPVTLNTLGNFILEFYHQAAPTFFYHVTDPLSQSPGTVYWYQTPEYRIGLKSVRGKTKIFDLRVYNPKIYEDYFVTPNITKNFYLETAASIDTLRYPDSAVVLNIDLEQAKLSYEFRRVKFTSTGKSLELTPTGINFSGLSLPPVPNGMQLQKTNGQETWLASPQTPFAPKVNHLYLLFAILIPALLVAFIFNRPVFFGLLFVSISLGTVIRSGSLFPFGLGFWGPNGHDAVFHISLIQSFAQNPFDFTHPQISGQMIGNYHIFFDYLSGLITRFSHLSSVTVYFVILPIFICLSLVFLLDRLLSIWDFSKGEKIIAYFLAFLCGSFGFIPSLIENGNFFSGESVFWANQSISWLLNPPFALSLVFLVLFLILIEKKRPKNLIWLVVVGGILAQTKIYSFLLLVATLFLLREWVIFFLVSAFGGLILLPFTHLGGSPFSFHPLWFNESLFASHDRVWWPKFAQAWQTYQADGSILKLILVNGFALIVFIAGNLGIRLAGISEFFGKHHKLSENIALIISLIGIVIPLLFIQKINPWNTVQFLYYSLFFLGLFSARPIYRLFIRSRSPFAKFVAVLLLLLLTLPTTIGTLRDYFTVNSSSRISYTELSALEFLKKQPQGIVLSPVYSGKYSRTVPEPKSLYGYVSTAYISALSGQKEFLSDMINLDITGYNYTERENDIQRLQNTTDSAWARKFLSDNNITYIYQTPQMKLRLNPDRLCLTKIFDSGEINIYKFNCHGKN